MKRILIFILILVSLISSSFATEIIFSNYGHNGQVIGYSTSNQEKLAQTITGNGEYIYNLTSNFGKSGSPTDKINITVYGDGGTAPNSSIYGYMYLNASDISTAWSSTEEVTMTPNSDIFLQNGTTYWLVIERTGSLSTTDWIGLKNNQSNDYAGGKFWVYQSSVWSQVGTGQYDLWGKMNTGTDAPSTPTSVFSLSTNTQSYYNSENISIDINTSLNSNISYYLDNNNLINNDSLVAYYPAELNFNDELGTFNGTDYNGVDFNWYNNSYGYAFNFDGVDDYIEIGDVMDTSNSFTITFWYYKPATSAVTAYFYKSRGTGNVMLLNQETDDTIKFKTWNSVNSASDLVSSSTLGTGWYYLTFVYDSSTTNKSIYINGVYDNSHSVTDVAEYANTDLFGGDPGNYLNGSMDEIRIYTKALNQTEITELYTTIPYNSICEDCNSSTININTNEGTHTITYMPFSNGVLYSEEESFIIDITSPTINNNILSEYDSYDFDLNSSCSDTYIDYCYIIINSQNITLPNDLNATLNGNLSYTIYSGDLAGNTNTETGVTLVNPFINFYFNNSINGDILSDYLINVGSLEYETNNTLIQIPLYDIGLGSADFIFIKDGYVTETFNYNLTNSSDINDTNEVTPVTLTIKVYDVDTLVQLTFDITIDNGSTIQTFTNQTNFYKLYNETPTGDLSLYIESEEYSPAYFYTTLNPDTSITYTAYLINSSTTTSHIFTVQDSATEDALQDVLIEIQEIINSTYTTIAQKVTASNGLAYFNLDATKEYKVILTKNGYVSATATTIPSITTYTVKLTQSTTAFSYIEDISYSFSPSGTILKDNETYLMSAFISGSGLSLTSFELVFSNGSVIYYNTNTNPAGTTFSYNLVLPYQINNTGITATLTYIKDGVTTELVKEYQIISITNTSFIASMENFGSDTSEDSVILKWLVMMSVIVIIIVGGTFMGTQTINLAIIPALSFFAFIGWLSWTYSLLLIFISIVFFIGGRR